MMLRRSFTTALLAGPLACASGRGYAVRRAGHVTRLRKHGPSPGTWKP